MPQYLLCITKKVIFFGFLKVVLFIDLEIKWANLNIDIDVKYASNTFIGLNESEFIFLLFAALVITPVASVVWHT